MTTFNGTYETDVGRDLFAVSLYTRFVVAEDAEFVPDEGPLLPEAFTDAVSSGAGPCRMPVTPRRALLYYSDRIQLELPIPFRGGTAAYSQMRSQIENNSLVQAYDILPEEIPPDKVLQLLRA